MINYAQPKSTTSRVIMHNIWIYGKPVSTTCQYGDYGKPVMLGLPKAMGNYCQPVSTICKYGDYGNNPGSTT